VLQSAAFKRLHLQVQQCPCGSCSRAFKKLPEAFQPLQPNALSYYCPAIIAKSPNQQLLRACNCPDLLLYTLHDLLLFCGCNKLF
jgi:hypothetical protein